MNEQAKGGQVMIRVEHVVNKRNEVFGPTLNNILSAVKDMAEGIKAIYEEKITLGEGI